MVAYTERTGQTIAAIRDYDTKKLIIANTPVVIKDKYDSLGSPASPKLDGMPRVHNPQAGEEHIVNTLDMIADMNKRYENAVVFVAWFEPMWLALTDAERHILETYKHSDIRSGLIGETAEDLNYSPRHLRRTRQRALTKLEKLLYGD